MGTCMYCGKSAGMFSTLHNSCIPKATADITEYLTSKSDILYKLNQNVIPVFPEAGMRVCLQRNEHIVWVESNIKYSTDKTTKSYVGRSRGMSIRVAPGLYYRCSGNRGTLVEQTSQELTDIGWIILTNKHVHFDGGSKTFRISYKKACSIQYQTGGFTLVKDGVRPSKHMFVSRDGSDFLFQVATKLSRM